MSSMAEGISLPVGIRQKLEACIESGKHHLDFADITPEGMELEKWHVAHAILFLIAYGGNSNFRGPMKCPVKTVRVTTQGPAFDLQSLVYGKALVMTDCYPQLEPYDLLVLGLAISINLCREGSTLEHIDVSGNAIAERDFTEYILSGLSLSGTMSSDAEEIVVGGARRRDHSAKVSIVAIGQFDGQSTDFEVPYSIALKNLRPAKSAGTSGKVPQVQPAQVA